MFGTLLYPSTASSSSLCVKLGSEPNLPWISEGKRKFVRRNRPSTFPWSRSLRMFSANGKRVELIFDSSPAVLLAIGDAFVCSSFEDGCGADLYFLLVFRNLLTFSFEISARSSSEAVVRSLSATFSAQSGT